MCEKICRQSSRPAMRGFSLVELMVGIVIALIASVIIFQVFAVSESYKRATTGGSDALQSGGFSAYSLSRIIGAGGAGFALAPNAFGCALGVFRGDTQLFGQTDSPYRIATALPEPFETAVNFKISLAPALIIDGGTNPDVIMVMAGNHPAMGRHSKVASQAADSIAFADDTVVGINNSLDSAGNPQHDLLLAVDQDAGAARGIDTTCDIAEAVDAPVADIPVAGSKSIPSPILLSTNAYLSGPNRFKGTGTPPYYSKSLVVSNLGPISVGPTSAPTPPVPGSGPQFVLLGVGTDGTTANSLLSLNLLTGYCPAVATGCSTADTWVSQSLADNIISIKAIYGVAAEATDQNVSSWVAATGATWGASALSANRNNLHRIRAIRLAVVARNAQPERAADTAVAGAPGFSPASFTLFGDTSVSKSVANPDRKYRYKVFDITIPLRNMVLMTQNS